MQQFRQIIVQMRFGQSDRALASTGLCGRRKAAEIRDRAKQAGWLDPDIPLPGDEVLARVLAPSSGRSDDIPDCLKPWQDEIRNWHEEGVVGTTIYRALVRKYGFSGSYATVNRFLKRLKRPKVTTVLDFKPAESAQVDFGQGPKITDAITGEVVKTWIFAMVLSWSRHLYAELVLNQKVETWLMCHRRAFEWFDGVPQRLIIDNAKCAIVKACYFDPQVQRSYGECAEGYGFMISPCPVNDPKKKGRIESGVKLVKNSFVPTREFRSLMDGNEQLKTWLMEEAGQRCHGTTREKPLTLFAEEQPLLAPLPTDVPVMGTWTTVKLHGDCHVQFEKCRYSAPYAYVGKSLDLRATLTLIELFHQQTLVAVHSRLFQPGKRSTNPDHLPPEDRAFRMRDPQWCLTQAKRIGDHCHALIEALFQDRVLDNLRAAQGIVALSKTYGNQRLDAACERALAFDNIRYQAVKSILHNGFDKAPLPSQDEPPLSSAHQGLGRFCRDTKTLLN